MVKNKKKSTKKTKEEMASIIEQQRFEGVERINQYRKESYGMAKAILETDSNGSLGLCSHEFALHIIPPEDILDGTLVDSIQSYTKKYIIAQLVLFEMYANQQRDDKCCDITNGFRKLMLNQLQIATCMLSRENISEFFDYYPQPINTQMGYVFCEPNIEIRLGIPTDCHYVTVHNVDNVEPSHMIEIHGVIKQLAQTGNDYSCCWLDTKDSYYWTMKPSLFYSPTSEEEHDPYYILETVLRDLGDIILKLSHAYSVLDDLGDSEKIYYAHNVEYVAMLLLRTQKIYNTLYNYYDGKTYHSEKIEEGFIDCTSILPMSFDPDTDNVGHYLDRKQYYFEENLLSKEEI